MNKLIIVLSFALLFGCSQPEKTSVDSSINSTIGVAGKNKPVSAKTNFTNEEIAKFAISTIMNQSPSIMKAETKEDITISYVKNDSKKFDYKIKIEGNNIIWGTETGRWRNAEYDEKIAYEIVGDSLVIRQTFSDGSTDKKSFGKNNL